MGEFDLTGEETLHVRRPESDAGGADTFPTTTAAVAALGGGGDHSTHTAPLAGGEHALLADGYATVQEIADRAGRGAGGSFAITGQPYTTETAHFQETDADYPWMGFANPEQVVLAWGQAGDAFPRVCLLSDITDGWYFGDGTYDAYTASNPPQMFVSGYDFYIRGGGPDAPGAELALRDASYLRGHSAVYLGTYAGGFGFIQDADGIAFFQAPRHGQEAYIAPGSITTAQIGQILIDFGLMAAS